MRNLPIAPPPRLPPRRTRYLAPYGNQRASAALAYLRPPPARVTSLALRVSRCAIDGKATEPIAPSNVSIARRAAARLLIHHGPVAASAHGPSRCGIARAWRIDYVSNC